MSHHGAKGKVIRNRLTWLLSLLFILSFVMLTAVMANNSDPEPTITVNLRATGLDGDIFNVENYEVAAGEITISGHTLDRHTAMGAVAAYVYEEGINFEIKDWGWGITVDQIGDDDSNKGYWSYYVNGTSPMVGADQYTLSDGDSLHFVHSNLARYTLSLGIDKNEIEAGETVTVSVQYTDGDGNTTLVEGADIYVSGELDDWGSPVAADTPIGQTDGSGKLSFTLNQTGTFYPYAEWNNESSRYQWPTVSLTVGKKTVTLDPLDSDWVKNGHTVLDALLKFQQADGSFWWQEDTAGAVKGATAQSLAALVDLAYGESTKHRAGQAPDYDPKHETLSRAIKKAVKWYQTNYPAPENWEGLPALRTAGEDLNSAPWQCTQGWRNTDPGFAADATGNEHIHYIFRLLSVGLDPANIWGNRNLFAELADQQQENGSFGELGKHIWAIVALDAGRELGKNVGSWSAAANRESAVNYLLAQQNHDGSFGAFSQLDNTGWALVALSNYMEDPGVDVNAAINDALTFLKGRQQEGGGFAMPGEWGAENANTNAAVISGLVAVGEDLAIEESAIRVDDAPLSITIPQGAAGARLNASTTTEGDKETATLPSIEVEATSPLGIVRLDIFQGTKVSGPGNWNGSIKLPELLDNSSVNVSDGTVSAVIEVGFPEGQLDFDKPVRLLISGQAGKSVGYTRAGAPVTEITKTLSSDSRIAASAELSSGEAGKIDVGDDLVIWTTHFTKFVAYTPETGNNGSSPGSGGQASSSISVSVQVTGKSFDYFFRNVVLPANRANALEALRETGIPFSTRENDAYIYEIAGEREDLTTTAGWKYMVNGVIPDVPAKSYSVSNGDEVIWFWAADAGVTGPGAGAAPRIPTTALTSQEMERLKEITSSARKQLAALRQDGIKSIPLEKALNLTVVIGTGSPMGEEEKEALKKKLTDNIVSIFQLVDPGEDTVISDTIGEVLLQVDGGSLASGAEFTVEEISAVNLPAAPDHKPVSPVYRLGPGGTEFSRPVFFSIRLAVPDEHLPAELVLAWLDEKNGQWYALPAVVDLSSGYISALLDHFSIFAVFAPQKAEEPAGAVPAFNDVTPEKYPWAYEAVNYLAGHGIIKGVGDGRFEPSRDVTRAEFAAMLVNALGLDTGRGKGSPFTDISKGSWYFDAVNAAMQAGIVKGVTETAFKPDEKITREQMAVMLSRVNVPAAGMEMADVSFADAGTIAPWAQDSVIKAVSRGLMKGFPDGSFQPLGTTTRAQAAVVLHGLLILGEQAGC